jgi:transposase InsO family protein
VVALAHERPRVGYRRVGVLLEREGKHVNHKRLFRVYRDAGLSVKRNRRKKLVRISVSQPVLAAPNDEWSLDFVYDALATGRRVRVLSVVDNFTRECLALEVDTSFASQRVTRILGSSTPAFARACGECETNTHDQREQKPGVKDKDGGALDPAADGPVAHCIGGRASSNGSEGKE